MGTMTITTTAPQDVRLIAAYTDLLQPEGGGDVSAAEIKARIIQDIKGVVHTFETRAAAKTATDAIVPMEPT